MTTASRHEFPEKTRRVVGERAAYICSNPGCRRPTIGPHSDPAKSLKTGKASHIRAAAPGGPRYDPGQSEAERKHIENAIYLCAECADTVDKDEAAHPVPLLLGWRREHEDWLRNGGIVPALPEVTLTTAAGLALPDVPATVTAADCAEFREHHLVIRNRAAVPLANVALYLQLPEPAVAYRVTDRSPGCLGGWKRAGQPMQVIATGGGGVTRLRPPLPPVTLAGSFSEIPPSFAVETVFLTSMKPYEAHDLTPGFPFGAPDDPKVVLYYLEGRFQFEYRGATMGRAFFSPIRKDEGSRSFELLGVSEGYGDWKPVKIDMVLS